MDDSDQMHMHELAETSPDTRQELSEAEKRIRDDVIKTIMSEINPLLEYLKQIPGQIIHQNAEAKVQELERGIQERMNARMNKINATMHKGRF